VITDEEMSVEEKGKTGGRRDTESTLEVKRGMERVLEVDSLGVGRRPPETRKKSRAELLTQLVTGKTDYTTTLLSNIKCGWNRLRIGGVKKTKGNKFVIEKSSGSIGGTESAGAHEL